MARTGYIKPIHLFTVIAISYAMVLGCSKDNSNNTPAPVQLAVITTLSANSGLPNSVIAITGTNFTSDASVSVGNVTATVISVTATEIDFIVPANAISGKVILTTNNKITIYPQNFTVVALVATGPLYSTYYRHMSAGTGIYISAGIDIDSVQYLYSYTTGFNNQFTGYNGGTFQPVPIQTQLWGIAYTGGFEYFASPNDYKIYKSSGDVTSTYIFAGSGSQGTADGQGAAAQFMSPKGMAYDAQGNIYVNDAHRVRKITPAGLVTTLAGSGADGHADGQGALATFGNLYDITIDASGNLYVTDNEYLNIRKISATGLVTTFAGSGIAGFTDGLGKAAQFYSPKGITIDGTGNLFVSDSNYNNVSAPTIAAIRMINPVGTVTTVLSSANGDQIGNPGSVCFSSGGLYICSASSSAAPQKCFFASTMAK